MKHFELLTRMCAFFMLAFFMAFATPTPMTESGSSEAAHPSMSRGTEFHSSFQTRSPSHGVSKWVAPLLLLNALLALLGQAAKPPAALAPTGRHAYLPLIQLALKQRLLLPLKFTSTFV